MYAVTSLPFLSTRWAGSGEGAPNLEGLIHDYLAQIQPPLPVPRWRTLTSFVTLHNSDSDGVIAVPRLDSQQAQQVLVQMSRIRRMCRTLVDCNNGGSSTGKVGGGERLSGTFARAKEKESKCHREASDGLTVMGRCWGAIVYSEVAQVLGRLAEWDSPYSIAVEMVRLYDQLKQVMLELFGGRSHFALAMKEGFSKAFQGLNEVEGVKVRGCATSVHV